jgi:hypothetical protein
MPVLANARHERFAQELAKGATQIAAYETAGFKPNQGHAARLASNGMVAARIAELKGAAAERAIVTIYDIADQLDEDRQFAREMEVPGAAITATMGKAKVLGLLVDRTEVTGKDGGPIVLSNRERAKKLLHLIAKARAETKARESIN